MELSANAQMLRAEIEELISMLGIDQKESGDVLATILEDLVKPEPPQQNPEEFITKFTLDEVKAKLKLATRQELEKWFLFFFPRGSPKLLVDGDIRSYIGAAVNFRKKVLGNCP